MKLIYRTCLTLLVVGYCAGAVAALDAPLRRKLANGIPVVIQDTLSSPTVSLNIFIRVGSVHESSEVNGVSHFYEHMFFRGTPRRTGLQFKREIEGLGGTTNAETTKDYTHFYINLPKAYTRQGLEILADAYLNAEVSPESVKAEREVVLQEYRLGRISRLASSRIDSTNFFFLSIPTTTRLSAPRTPSKSSGAMNCSITRPITTCPRAPAWWWWGTSIAKRF
jgi:hypothetical protein